MAIPEPFCGTASSWNAVINCEIINFAVVVCFSTSLWRRTSRARNYDAENLVQNCCFRVYAPLMNFVMEYRRSSKSFGKLLCCAQFFDTHPLRFKLGNISISTFRIGKYFNFKYPKFNEEREEKLRTLVNLTNTNKKRSQI